MNEEKQPNIYYIPKNSFDTGYVFGGQFKTRNFVEAVILTIPFLGIFIFGWMKLKWNVQSTVAYCFIVCAAVFMGTVVGVGGDSLFEFISRVIRFRQNKRISKYNPRIKSELEPDYLMKDGRMLPKEKLKELMGAVEGKVLGANDGPISADIDAKDLQVFYEDDEGILEKPDELKTKAELKAEAKQRKKEEDEYIKSLPRSQRKAARARLKQEKLEREQEAQKRKEAREKAIQEAVNHRLEKAERIKAAQIIAEQNGYELVPAKSSKAAQGITAEEAVAKAAMEPDELTLDELEEDIFEDSTPEPAHSVAEEPELDMSESAFEDEPATPVLSTDMGEPVFDDSDSQNPEESEPVLDTNNLEPTPVPTTVIPVENAVSREPASVLEATEDIFDTSDVEVDVGDYFEQMEQQRNQQAIYEGSMASPATPWRQKAAPEQGLDFESEDIFEDTTPTYSRQTPVVSRRYPVEQLQKKPVSQKRPLQKPATTKRTRTNGMDGSHLSFSDISTIGQKKE